MTTGWTPSCGDRLPPRAFCIGKTKDGEDLYVGRGRWNGSLTPGRVHPSQAYLYIPYQGKEERIDGYEVLVKHR